MSNEQHELKTLIRKSLDSLARTDLNLESDVARDWISDHIFTEVNQYVNQLIEDIVSPCGVVQKD